MVVRLPAMPPTPPEFHAFEAALRAVPDLDLRFGEPLHRHSTWHIGGPAFALAQPATEEQVARLLSLAVTHAVPVFVLGGGSNLLFDDAGFRGLVLKLGPRLSDFTIAADRIRGQAGAPAPRLAWAAARAGLAGLELHAGIPGTLGGILAMNAGAMEGIAAHVEWVRCLAPDGRFRTLTRDGCRFAYRQSVFQDSPDTIVEAELRLTPDAPDAIRRRTLDGLRGRHARFPLQYPNAGSVFLHHAEMTRRFGPAGKVIEDCALKGESVGDAQVSERHANFIVNRGHARSADVLALIGRVRRRVHERTGLWLECEVRHVSPEGRVRPAHEAGAA
jgi:UDP-N-acetylmuramate dehydrogenase